LRSREITSRPLKEIKDGKRKVWKWANMLLPSILIIGLGFLQLRNEKKRADVLRQIYD